jgi:hypothetical protein
MRLRNKSAWVLAGLAGLVVTFVGEREVQAGSINIVGKSGTVGGTDPFYFYDFQITLGAGYQLNPGDFVTINDIIGVTPVNIPGTGSFNSALPVPGSFSSQPSPFDAPIITLTDPTPNYTSNVEWQYPVGESPILGGASGTYLGDFIILTSVPLSNPQTSVTFDSSVHSQSAPTGPPVTQNGVMIAVSTIPEPSSVSLLLAGSAAIPLLLWSERRRRQRLSQPLSA